MMSMFRGVKCFLCASTTLPNLPFAFFAMYWLIT
eukprot:CAMPEP_0182567836 /NCGR_PEP_ID=MMETSP1324-20130603/8947_1 /TAXON_ID=236786 /ORGANISM="Florenciella sp., Strain RCC1587" /LENGTH=33 /DNA_ID= /DNA_START= /DNA_END= /DNA_ORIENTATION=